MQTKIKKPISVFLSLVMLLSVFAGLNVLPAAQAATDAPAYLTFTGTDSFSIKVGSKGWNGTLEYSTDGDIWNTWDGSEINSAGNVLYLRGTGNTKIGGNSSRKWIITAAGTVACSGDIRTLLNYQDPDAAAMADYCFSYLFYNCTSLTAAPGLPATTLAGFCYSYMFSGCTGLTAAPELPATTLANYCYQSMFSGCTGLTVASELPATTLVRGCYQSMFSGCTGLTAAPALPATTLAEVCYNNMFYACTGLTAAPALPATTLEDYCYTTMFSGCTGIKLSTVQTDEYNTPYRIPEVGEGTTASSALTSMFNNTGGTFTGTPSINTTYYMIPPHVHDYRFDSFVWAADNTAKAKYVCFNNADHIEYYDAEVTSVFTAATCEADAYMVYTAAYDGHTEDKTVTDEGSALNHDYRFDSFVWAADNTVQAKYVCANDAEHVLFYDAVVTSAFTAATCEADAYTVYTATYDGHTEDKTVTNENSALNHDYRFDSFVWAADNTVQAKYVCANDAEHVLFYDAVVTSAFTAATCEADAYTVYTATYDGHTEDKTVTDEGTATDHDYRFDSFVWAADNTAKAKYVCANDAGHVVFYDAVVTSAFTAATCEADAYTVYTATYDGHTDDKTVTDEGTATDHDYRFDSFVWAADNTAKAKLVCANDADHVTLVDAMVTSETTAPTATEDGFTVYTATYEGHSEEKTAVDEGSATGEVTPPDDPSTPTDGEKIHGEHCFCYNIPDDSTMGSLLHFLCGLMCALLKFLSAVGVTC